MHFLEGVKDAKRTVDVDYWFRSDILFWKGNEHGKYFWNCTFSIINNQIKNN